MLLSLQNNKSMAIMHRFCISVILLAVLLSFQACRNKHEKSAKTPFRYKAFKDSIAREKYDTTGDASNIFDAPGFTPGNDSLIPLLQKIDTIWRRDAWMMQQVDTIIKLMKTGDTVTPEKKAAIQENLNILDSFLTSRPDTAQTNCRQKDCFLYAEIIKSSQTMYLYVGGELVDSFKVSTGIKKRETPNLSVRPSGPIFTKYNSKKFPGGNYQGLGNMPYAVFIRGGYAIHGTTPGNFKKLGTRASHGCIRLHPYNARIFYELVKRIGLSNTWVSLKDSLQ
jgi:Uncharacterized protein conserved in bacteria